MYILATSNPCPIYLPLPQPTPRHCRERQTPAEHFLHITSRDRDRSRPGGTDLVAQQHSPGHQSDQFIASSFAALGHRVLVLAITATSVTAQSPIASSSTTAPPPPLAVPSDVRDNASSVAPPRISITTTSAWPTAQDSHDLFLDALSTDTAPGRTGRLLRDSARRQLLVRAADHDHHP